MPKLKLAPHWRRAHKLGRVQLGLAWSALGGLYAAWGALQELLPPLVFVGASIGMSMVLTAGHLLELPGADDGRN